MKRGKDFPKDIVLISNSPLSNDPPNLPNPRNKYLENNVPINPKINPIFTDNDANRHH
jgi:hypothetical protein